ncbi:MAG TPA: MBL fold metallo-hydrolase, partial [Longimicrobiaceae bacterium]|nr:MBL fold metallo-hydrolase [Longimicrobiaceae bacterium]
DGTRTFLVGSARPAVIDPGPADAAHLDALLAALGGVRPVAILLTHAHPDHAAAAPALAERTGAPLRMGRGSLAQVPGARALADGEGVDTDAGLLIALVTPGHAPEHLCFLWTGGDAPPGGALFAGDHFMGGSDTTLVSPPEGDLAAYLRSLDRVAAVAPGIVYPAHGPPLTDPAAAVERYRAHRYARIGQVMEALRGRGPSPAGALVDAVYGPGLPPALRPAAAGSVAAVLDYLLAAGRVRALDGGTYTLAE